MHIPGAVHLDYAQIVAQQAPVGGLLPDARQLGFVLGALGLGPATHVVAYDDEGGGKACRLLWTLACLGHSRYSLLNGGLHAWANEGYPLNNHAVEVQARKYTVAMPDTPAALANAEYILEHLNDPAVALLDARSMAEFTGEKRFAERGGHIPGAANIEWTAFMDPKHHLRLRGSEQIEAMLTEAGIRRDQTVVAYCQTHHRSAHTWFVLTYLGYTAKGYEGSWSDWGNRADTPVA